MILGDVSDLARGRANADYISNMRVCGGVLWGERASVDYSSNKSVYVCRREMGRRAAGPLLTIVTHT